jgi:hypothetical protein
VKKPFAFLRIATPNLFTRKIPLDPFHFPYTTSVFAD